MAVIIRLPTCIRPPLTSVDSHRTLTPDEAALIDTYRAKPPADQAALLQLSFELSNDTKNHEHLA